MGVRVVEVGGVGRGGGLAPLSAVADRQMICLC